MGFEVELAEAIANSLQVELELIPVSAKQRTPMLLQNKADLILATMTLTRKRDEAIDFSIPYFQVGQGLLLSENSNINSFMDLKNKKTAVLEGTQAFHTLSRVQPDTRLVIVSSYEEGIQKILNKEVHALASDHLLLMGLLFAHESREELRLLGQTFAPDPYGIAMRENESTLRDHINAAIMELWEEGTWHDIYDTWFGEGSMYGHDLMFRIDVIPR
jgi:ABC-type amino acid transport substrate-binding protein